MERPGVPSGPRFAFTRAETRALLVLAALLLIGLVAQQVRRHLDRDSGDVILENAVPLDSSVQGVAHEGVTSRTNDSSRLDLSTSKGVTSPPKPLLDPVPSREAKSGAGGVISGGEGVSRTGETVAGKKLAPGEQRLDLNHASTADLQRLPGIGPVLASRIVNWRGKHGPFKKVDDLLLVRGIGAKRLKKLRSYVSVTH